MFVLLNLLLHSFWISFLFQFVTIVLIIRCLLGTISRFPGKYGRLLRLSDCMFDEDFLTPGPKCNIVSTFELDGDITIENIRNIFEERVLRAKIGDTKSERLRYPEFQQYVTTVFGFLIWKNEDNFNIAEHIFEEEAKSDLLEMGDLHQALINRQFFIDKSPWELVLIRNVIPVDQMNDDEHEKRKVKTILAFKMHHIMGDVKSILKIFVECIGEKRLKTAEAHSVEMTLARKVSFFILFPMYVIREWGKVVRLMWKHNSHPWKVGRNNDSKLIVKFTKSINIIEMKTIASENGVTLSAVILSVIAGAMQRFNKTLSKGTMLAYILPKENHPSVLANHARGVVDLLPITMESSQSASPSNRLRLYDSFFKSMRQLERCIPSSLFANVMSTLPRSSLQKALCFNYYAPVGITNIAGDREGFSIGGAWCSGHRLSASAPRGVAGVVFCIFSYRNQLRIALIGKESVISESDAMAVVSLIGQEYDSLKRMRQ